MHKVSDICKKVPVIFITNSILFVSVFLYPFSSSVASQASLNNVLSAEEAMENVKHAPFAFFKNKGQWDNKILYQGKLNNGISVRFLENEISFSSSREIEDTGESANKNQYRTSIANTTEGLVWNMKFENANNNIQVSGEKEQESNINYLVSFSPEKWAKNIPKCAVLTYNNIYNNIDLKYYGTNNGLKYDYILHKRGSINDIRSKYLGTDGLTISDNGNLEIKTSWGIVVEKAPYAYQVINGKIHEVPVKYHLYDTNTFGFKLYGNYDNNYDLIIDPFFLKWATYTGSEFAYSNNIDKDINNNVYITGYCDATYPVTPGAYQTTPGSGYITKLSRDGSTEIYSTFIPAMGLSIKVNNAGEAFVTGADAANNAYIVRMNVAGNGIIYSASIGGSGQDYGTDIDVDNSTGDAYITGWTTSANFPCTPGAFQNVLKGTSDAFVVKINAAGTVVYSTYIGGTAMENGLAGWDKGFIGNGIAVNAGEAFVTGLTSSADFPVTAGCFQPGYGGGISDAFVARLNTTGTALMYATYLGGNSIDMARGIAVNNAKEAYVTGGTYSANFPTSTGAIQTVHAGNTDAFLTKLNSTGTAIGYSTFIGGIKDDEGYGIALNCEGEAYVSGITEPKGGSPAEFPLVGAYQTLGGGGHDFFISVVSFNGQSLLGSTIIGGNGDDYYQPCIVLLSETCGADTIAVNGTSHSTNFPVTPGAFRTSNLAYGPDDPVVFKMYFTKTKSISNNATICKGSSVQLSASGGLSYSWSPATGLNSSTIANPIATPSATTTYVVTMGCLACTYSVTVTVSSPVVTINAPSNICSGGSATVSATVSGIGGYRYLWLPPGNTTSTVAGLSAGTYSLTVTDSNGCTGVSAVTVTVNPLPVIAISGSHSICLGSTASFTASGANTYIWSTNKTTASITVAPAVTTTYSVVGTDSNGCTGSTIITLTVNSLPVANAGPSVTLCEGASTILSASGGISYVWTPSSGLSNPNINNPVANPSVTTTYTVVVTNVNGCTGISSVTVTRPPLLTVVIPTSTSVTCNGGINGTATALGSGGTTTYSYLWNNGQNNATATGLSAGTYTITITDANGCTARTSATITQPTILTAAITASTSVSCNPANAGGTGSGNNGTATALGSGGTTTYSYSWNNGQNNATATGLAAGSYTVIVTDSNGCTSRSSATITQPSALTLTLSSTNSTCSNANGGTSSLATGGTPTYSYRWNTTAITPGLSNIAAGIYSLTVTDSNGCSISRSVTVNNSGAPTVTITATNNLCFGDNRGTATASASGGTGTYTYSWSNGGTTFTISHLIASIYSVTVTDTNGCTALASVLITQPTVLTANASVVNNVSCFGGNNGAVLVNAGGGTSTYSYSWNNGGTTVTLSHLIASIYSVTVTDANNCIQTATITVTEPPELTINVVANPASCNGGASGTSSIQVNGGTPSYHYLWDMGATTAIVSGLTAGTYSFVITDNNSCSQSSSITISEPNQLVANTSVVNNVLCFGENSGKALVNTVGGTSPYHYQWTNNTTTQQISNLTAGSYTITVTDANDCSITNRINITEPTLLQATTNTTNVSCNGANNGSTTVNPSGGTIQYSYLWSNNATTQSINNLFAGTYSVTTTDNNGCTVTTTVTVTEPSLLTLTITSTNVNCFGDNSGTAAIGASGGTSSYLYSWSNTSASAALNNLVAGIYSVTVTDSNGCSQTASTTITQPTLLTATVTTVDALCFGDNNGSAAVLATGGTPAYSYVWTTGETTLTISHLTASIYLVTITDANGCIINANGTVSQPAPLTLTLSSTNSTCGNANGSASSIVSGGTIGYTYNWSNGAITSTISHLTSSVYSLTVTDSNGCSVAQSVTVNNSGAPTLTVTTTDALCFGDNSGSTSVNASGGTGTYNYSWNNGQSQFAISNLQAGVYSVTVTDSNGCTTIASGTVNQPTLLTATITSFTNVSCNGGNNGSATALGSGGSPNYSYSWSNGEAGSPISHLASQIYSVTVTDANGCTAATSITITQPTLLTATVTTVDALCFGDNNGSTTVNASGGTGTYTYSWSNGSSQFAVSNLQAGNYSITVTDANGCSATANGTVGQPAVLSLSLTSVNSTCGNPNGTASSSAGGGTTPYTYLWNNGSINATISGLLATIYSLTVTDGNGCSSTSSITVNNSGAPSATVTATDALCLGDNTGSASVTASGGTGTYNYSWNNGQTTSAISQLTSSIYSVTVTDGNGCSTIANGTVNEPTLLTLTVTTINDLCFGDNNGSATVNATGGTGPYNYNWSNGQNNAAASGLIAAVYSVTVTDANGCSATESATITQPSILTASVITTDALCFGDNNGSATVNVTGGTTGYSYLWSTAESTSAISHLTSSIYSVTVTDANGCSATANGTVNQPTLLTSTVTTTTTFCFGDNTGTASVAVNGGTGAYIYNWSNGGAASPISNLTSQIYSVTVTDQNGCSVIASGTVDQLALLTLTVTTTDALCFGDNSGTASVTTSGGTGTYNYSWNSGQSQFAISNLQAGVYSVTVTDSNGCTTIASGTVNQPTLLTATVTTINPLCFGDNNGSAAVVANGGTAAYSYLWSNGEAVSPISNLISQTYSVTVTDANGCSATTSATITQPTILTATVTIVDALCFGDNNGSATVNASGGTGAYVYLWSNGEIVSPISHLTSQIYSVTVTDQNGCSANSNGIVNHPPVITLTVTTTNALCSGDNNGSAVVIANGGTTIYNYNWSNGAISAINNGLIAGIYSVTVTDTNGCSKNASRTVSQPEVLTATITTTSNICFGDNTGTAFVTGSGGTNPYNYNWSNGSIATTNNNLPAGIYSVTLTDNNGCITTATTTINQPSQLVVNLTPDFSICNGTTTNLTTSAQGGTPSYNYHWNNGNNTTTVAISPSFTTVYSVTVTDTNGCTAQATTTVTVNSLPIISFSADDTAGCPTLCVLFHNNTPNTSTLEWNFGDGSPSPLNPALHCYTDPGSYNISLLVTDNNGCSNSLTRPAYIQVYPTPLAEFSISPEVIIANTQVDFTDLSAGSSSWQWSFGDLLNSFSTAQNPAFVYQDSGTYQVQQIVINQYGCADTAAHPLHVEPDFLFYIPNAFTPDGDGLNDIFYPQGMGIDATDFEMWIFDRWGNLIWKGTQWGQGWDGRANEGKEVAQIDTYVWKISLKDVFGIKHRYIGNVNLIK